MSFDKIFDIFTSLFKGTVVTPPSTNTNTVIPTPTETKKVSISLPLRSNEAITGSQFIQDNLKLTGQIRENNIIKEILSGNIPDFLRDLKEVTVPPSSFMR